MSGNLTGSHNRNSGNYNEGGDQIIGDRIFLFPPAPAEPRHQMHVVRRYGIPVTDRVTLLLNIVMTLCALVSAAATFLPTLAPGVAIVTHLPRVPIEVGFIALVASLVLAGTGWLFWNWLRRPHYAKWAKLGLVPESRKRPNGGHQLHLTKLRGTCAVDGRPMVPRLVVVGQEFVPTSNGNGEARPVRELRLVCTLERHDVRHQAGVDVTQTE